MNPAVDQLAISIFKKPLNECSAEELRQLAHQYPWFAPAQLLYTRKIQTGNPSLYEEQVQKSTLYFQNRLWLHHLLNDNGSAEVIAPATPVAEEKKETVLIHEPVPVLLNTNGIDSVITEPAEEPGRIMEEVIEEPQVQVYTNIAAEEAVMNTVAPQVEEKIMEKVVEEAPVLQAETEPALSIPRLKIEPVTAINTPFTFEPYHTIDYFASQGIKFKEDDKPKDQFGQQLKSFTEWLKLLKKIPASEIGVNVNDPGGEKKVEQLAEHSLAERHVITEAMAEVWIKQGNRARAEEIYRKLSLLDPLKTAYFAAKIEDLKKTS